ncbi:MauE/DoxX family redox-associated membrane protein [Actinoplanes xinjiangensis]|uniref:MauE/DoxX family redox-associated membrane protein n=1 Tax=Actinoplanes xinjiangensis TaxID=512350 RepID=UPI00341560FF
MRVVIASIILLIAGVLAVSLVSKLRTRSGYTAFADALVAMGITTPRRAPQVAALSVTAELVVLATLVWPGGALPGLAAATVLFAGFTAALVVAVRRGSGASCHCFGASDSPVAWRHVVRAAGLGALSAGGFGGTVVLPAASLTGLGAAQALIAVAVAGAGVAALVWLDDLAWLLRGSRSL